MPDDARLPAPPTPDSPTRVDDTSPESVGFWSQLWAKSQAAGQVSRDRAALIAQQTAKRTQQTFNTGTVKAGELMERVRANKILSFTTQFVPAGFIAGAVNGVKIEKSEALVRRLQVWYPNDSPRQIANRMMLQKAVQVGSIGFVSGLIPGFIAPLLLVDAATSAVLMAELVFQIAAAYGLDLRDPQRKGEVLAIFGIAFGGQQAVRLGVTALKAVPIAGAAIGGGTNAAMLFSLGHAACSFYESGGQQLDSEEAAAAAMQANAAYLAHAAQQEIVMDQISVLMLYAGGKQRPLPALLPLLEEQAGISSAAREVMDSWGASLPALESLLPQLEREFALVLLSQCRQMAWRDETVTPQEQWIIDMLAWQFQITPDELQALEEADDAASD